MKNAIEIKVGNNKLIAFVNDWEDDMPKEIFISLADENGLMLQDICMVREHYHYNPNTLNVEIDSSLIDCKVWADSGNEDYTNEFCISVYEEEDE